jgi:hypothetical protein
VNVVLLGILLPTSTLHHTWFAVLSAFVAINTVMYTALALGKIAPKIYLSDLVDRRDRRVANRSIHPTADERRTARGGNPPP